jgi:uncharacterized membrane protein YkvA (DUF1232 family)
VEKNMKIRKKAKQIMLDLPTVFFVLKDIETPILAKVIAGITIGYALSPIDLIPDFIPILGYLDDVLIVPALIILTIKFVPNEIWRRNKEKATGVWNDGKPKKWFFAIPILLIWALIVWLIVRAIWL